MPYTDSGIQVIGQGLSEALSLAQRRGFIAEDEPNADGTNLVPGFEIELPRSAQISVADKSARVLNDVKFRARVAGAIHRVVIEGSLTYDFNAFS